MTAAGLHQGLDARQRAMLQEMGITLFALPAAPAGVGPARPQAPAAQAPAPAPAAATPRSQSRHTAAASPTAPAPAMPAEAVRPQAPQPSAPAQPTLLLAPPVAPYATASGAAPAPQPGGWLVLLECAEPANPLAGDAGRLLDNMLRALRLHERADTRVAALLAPRPQDAGPDAGAVPLAQVLEQSRPQMVLLLGLGAARAVLGSRAPLAHLRAGAHTLAGGVPAVVSHDPAFLLHAPESKAAAWADLCHALARSKGHAGPGPVP